MLMPAPKMWPYILGPGRSATPRSSSSTTKRFSFVCQSRMLSDRGAPGPALPNPNALPRFPAGRASNVSKATCDPEVAGADWPNPRNSRLWDLACRPRPQAWSRRLWLCRGTSAVRSHAAPSCEYPPATASRHPWPRAGKHKSTPTGYDRHGESSRVPIGTLQTREPTRHRSNGGIPDGYPRALLPETSVHQIGIGGSGCPPSPATPPYMRVRIRRFRKLSP